MKRLTKLAPLADADQRAPNAYLESFRQVMRGVGIELEQMTDGDWWYRTLDTGRSLLDVWRERDRHLARYGFAIPNDEALGAIAAYAPGGVVELGAGTGYWAHMLHGRFGVQVAAYDTHPITPDGKSGNTYFDPRGTRESFFEVRQGDHAVLAHYPDATLLLCWPPYDAPMAADCLKAYRGGTVAYIGEGAGGCTGDDEFHGRLEYEWTEVEDIMIPQWHGIHDRLRIYTRGPDEHVAAALKLGVCDCEDWRERPCAVCWHAGKRVSSKYKKEE